MAFDEISRAYYCFRPSLVNIKLDCVGIDMLDDFDVLLGCHYTVES